jgi:hypothetical protein
MPTIHITPPSQIDGSTEEVLRATISQLEAVTPAIKELIDQSAVQVRNSWLSFEMTKRPDATPEELAAEWADSDLAKEVRNTRLAAEMIRRNVGRIDRLSGRGRGQKDPLARL